MKGEQPLISLLVGVRHQRQESMQVFVSILLFLFLGIQESLAQRSAAPTEGDGATVVAFVNVAVVSMQDEVLLQAQTVVIQGERILSIGPVDAIPVPPDATVIDGSGRYLIPGLADMHVHVQIPFDNGPVFLNAGITTVLSLGTRSTSHAATLQERERSHTLAFVGPTLHTVGPLIYSGRISPGAVRPMTSSLTWSPRVRFHVV